MAEPEPMAPILDDLPAHEDALAFEPHVDTLAGIIADPNTRTPLTIGIFGGWGTGKTSLMTMVRERLPADRFLTLWFDAWKYDKEEALWRVLLLRVLDALRPPEKNEIDDGAATSPPSEEDREKLRQRIGRLEEGLYRDVSWVEQGRLEIDWRGALKAGAGLVTNIVLANWAPIAIEVVKAAQKKMGEGKHLEAAADLAGAFRRAKVQHYQAQLRSLEQFQREFRNLVDACVHEQGGRRLVIFVDDLDRALPEKAVEVLEAIKLFLDVPHTIFVLGLDQKVVAQGIKVKYRDLALREGGEISDIPIDGAAYLEKIIQIPFLLPPIQTEEMAHYVRTLAPALPDERCVKVFAEGVDPNPRQVKRTINIFLLLWRRAQWEPAEGEEEEKRKRLQRAVLREEIAPVRLAKVVAVQHRHPDLYEVLQRTPRLLRELEQVFVQQARAGRGREKVRGTDGFGQPAEAETVPPVLQPFTERASLRRLLTLFTEADGKDRSDANFADLTPTQLRVYFSLARSVVAEPAARRAAAAKLTFEPQLVDVPAATFPMGASSEEIGWLLEHEERAKEWQEKGLFEREQPQHHIPVEPFQIGKYPVTNLEYQAFVQDTGYDPPRHWEGDQYPEEKADHPVVYVSWQDAMAYCQWLREKTGKEYRLPTEAEWERAAAWDAEKGSKRCYAWGDEWDPARCNTREGGPGGTTPVGQYSPDGDSPCRASDMTGNVWEWCSSLYRGYPYDANDGREDRDASGSRVLRGGSWDDDVEDAHCANRYRNYPGFSDINVGFRLVSPVLF